MNVLLITGNGRGLAGYAVGKAPLHRTNNAIIKAMNMAGRKLFYVELLEGRTIYHDFYAECRNTRIFAQRRPEGFGLHCHPRLIKICEVRKWDILLEYKCCLDNWHQGYLCKS
jgi:ribosomal protein S5